MDTMLGTKIMVMTDLYPGFRGRRGTVCWCSPKSDGVSVQFGSADNGDRRMLFPGEYEVIEPEGPLREAGSEPKSQTKEKPTMSKLAQKVTEGIEKLKKQTQEPDFADVEPAVAAPPNGAKANGSANNNHGAKNDATKKLAPKKTTKSAAKKTRKAAKPKTKKKPKPKVAAKAKTPKISGPEHRWYSGVFGTKQLTGGPHPTGNAACLAVSNGRTPNGSKVADGCYRRRERKSKNGDVVFVLMTAAYAGKHGYTLPKPS